MGRISPWKIPPAGEDLGGRTYIGTPTGGASLPLILRFLHWSYSRISQPLLVY